MLGAIIDLNKEENKGILIGEDGYIYTFDSLLYYGYIYKPNKRRIQKEKKQNQTLVDTKAKFIIERSKTFNIFKI